MREDWPTIILTDEETEDQRDNTTCQKSDLTLGPATTEHSIKFGK